MNERERESKAERSLEFLSICMILGTRILITFFHGILSMIKSKEREK